jgi:threonine/homoserine/homoserine lactone efflux protein
MSGGEVMGQAIGEMLPFAVALAIGPVPNIVVMLVLATANGRGKGLAFLAGWTSGLLVTGGIALAVVDPADPGEVTDPAAWVSWLRLAMALLLIAYAIKGWLARPGPDDEAPLPAWMGSLDGASPGKLAGFGLFLGSINPKSLAFTVAAVTAIAVADHAVGDQIVVLVVFALVASLGVMLPIGLAMSERGSAMLGAMKDGLVRHNTAVMSVLFLLLGASLLGDAISGLFG